MTRQETHPVLTVQGLTIQYSNKKAWFTAAEDVTFVIHQNETLALVGESGSGKSSIALAMLGLLTRAKVAGTVLIDGVSVYGSHATAIRELRRRHTSFVFQNPESGLLPFRTIGRQLIDVVSFRGQMNTDASRKKAQEWLELVGLAESEVWNRLPGELSGGMCQRVMLAMALCIDPKLVIADEPTSSLDALNQEKILALLRTLQRHFRFAMLFITHDMRIARHFADSLAVMRAGRIMETGKTEEIFTTPRNEYTRQLIASAQNISI